MHKHLGLFCILVEVTFSLLSLSLESEIFIWYSYIHTNLYFSVSMVYVFLYFYFIVSLSWMSCKQHRLSDKSQKSNSFWLLWCLGVYLVFTCQTFKVALLPERRNTKTHILNGKAGLESCKRKKKCFQDSHFSLGIFIYLHLISNLNK